MWNEPALQSADLRLTQTGGMRDLGLAEAVCQPRVPQIAAEFVHEHGGASGASVGCSLLPRHPADRRRGRFSRAFAGSVRRRTWLGAGGHGVAGGAPVAPRAGVEDRVRQAMRIANEM